MSDDRVSVIIRTFNRPEMLRRALASVAAQTWADKEAVVVNDGGEDVQEIVDEHADRLDIVYLSFEPERKVGRCLAATRGIEAATGSWIAYLDDDDVHFPDHLEVLMTAAKETGKLVLYTDAYRATEELTADGTYAVTGVEPGPSEDFSRAGFYAGCYIHLSTFCHGKSVFDKLGGFNPELPVLEDLDLFFRYAHDHAFHHIPKITAQYHIRTDDTNAVTAMRKEFQETNEMLAKKYLHIAISDMIVMIRNGRSDVIGAVEAAKALIARVDRLEARVAELEKRST